MAWPRNMNINENVQPPVDYETVTKYSVILFINLGEFRFNLCNDKDQTFFFDALTLMSCDTRFSTLWHFYMNRLRRACAASF